MSVPLSVEGVKFSEIPFSTSSFPRKPVSVLLERVHYEIFPGNNISKIIGHFKDGTIVSVTCSPVQGIAATQRLCEQLLDRGCEPIPHFSARLVNGPSHAAELAAWTKKYRVRKVFIIGGDVERATHYETSIPFVRDFLASKPEVSSIGIAVYPDGHPVIDVEDLEAAMIEKQNICRSLNVICEGTTQMCFDANKIIQFVEHARLIGFSAPIIVGVPGVVDVTKLMSISVRLGVGHSLRFLSNNASTISKLIFPRAYDPLELVLALGSRADSLNIRGIHCFTFNSTKETIKWVTEILKTS